MKNKRRKTESPRKYSLFGFEKQITDENKQTEGKKEEQNIAVLSTFANETNLSLRREDRDF